MKGLLILLLFPLAWPFIAKRIWHTTINWQEMALQIGIVTLMTVLVWQAGKYGQMQDVEIWNGSVVSKERRHGHYISSYSCNCRTTSNGSTECDTCYKDHYTVTWRAQTTVGDVTFAHRDSTSRSVYRLPDPLVYVRCTPGEPASIERSYVNYIKAVPESLFGHKKSAAKTFADSIPPYPRVYDFYKINRVVEVGAKLPESLRKKMNDELNTILKTLGAEKQMNIIVIATSIHDPNYRYALEDAWLGGKKNDVVLFFGLDGLKIIWTDVMTWALNSGNELLHVKMRDGLRSFQTIDSAAIVPFVAQIINDHFVRPKMKDFEYLKNEIDPPLWVIILAVIFAIGGSLTLTYVFHRVDINFHSR